MVRAVVDGSLPILFHLLSLLLKYQSPPSFSPFLSMKIKIECSTFTLKKKDET